MPIQENRSTSVTIDGKDYVYFGGTNYLGLSRRPELLKAGSEAFQKYGFSAGASRVTSGESDLILELENELHNFALSEAALVLPAGYMANSMVVDGIDDMVDAWVILSNAHSSIRAPLRQNGKPIITYKNDLGGTAIRERHNLKEVSRLAYMLEPIDPLTGELFDLSSLLPHLRENDFLILDEAHSFGVLGDTGRGAIEHFAVTGAGGLNDGASNGFKPTSAGGLNDGTADGFKPTSAGELNDGAADSFKLTSAGGMNDGAADSFKLTSAGGVKDGAANGFNRLTQPIEDRNTLKRTAVPAHRRGGLHPPAALIRTGTFSKAVGTYGGFILASADVISLVKQKSGGYKASTALSPVVSGATIESLRLIQADRANTVDRLKSNIKALNLLLAELGIEHYRDNCVPIYYLRNSPAITKLREELPERGIYIPTVTSYFAEFCEIGLRWTIQAGHSEEHFRFLQTEFTRHLITNAV